MSRLHRPARTARRLQRQPRRGQGQNGFTLIEVLVAVLLVTIGIFGFAKMQALAMSSTQIASVRSIVAMQASSLAATMQGNRAFWSNVAPASISMSGTTVTDATGVLSTSAKTCQAATKPATPACTPAELAARDVTQWATNLNNVLPSYSSTVICNQTLPIRCVITVNWIEKYVAALRNTVADSAATGGARQYSLHVEP